jgi:NAD(P)-dependent dehydrogenase (short-subunit alcohol dehydrogenase family)
LTETPLALVTGVGPGAGSAVVRRFAAGGFRVVAVARSPDRIVALAKKHSDTQALACDISDESQVRDMMTKVRELYGSLNLLIHSAVGGGWGTFLEIDPQMLERNFRINVMGLLYLARKLAPDMIRTDAGEILVTGNTSSIGGKADFAGFAAAKAAQRILAESMARDLGPKAIHVAYILIDAVIDAPRIRARRSYAPRRFLHQAGRNRRRAVARLQSRSFGMVFPQRVASLWRTMVRARHLHLPPRGFCSYSGDSDALCQGA